MSNWQITLDETFSKTFTIAAESADEAMEIVKQKYDSKDKDFVLKEENFKRAEVYC